MGIESVKVFLWIFWEIHMFIFQFSNMVYHIDLFENIEEHLDTGDKAHLIMMWDLFNMLIILFGRICLRVFACMFMNDFAYGFLFLCSYCLVLVLERCWPYRMNLVIYVPL